MDGIEDVFQPASAIDKIITAYKKLPPDNPWRPIETFDGEDYVDVDLWMNLFAADKPPGKGWRIPHCWRISGKWYNEDGDELLSEYITHWMPLPPDPEAPPAQEAVVSDG